MDNVPIFCGCHRFRKLMWEEYHNPVPKNDRMRNSKINYGRQYALRRKAQTIIHDAFSDDSLDGVNILSSDDSPQLRRSNNIKRALQIFDRKYDEAT